MNRIGIGLLLISLLVMLTGCPDPVDEPSTYTVTYDGNGNTAGAAPVDSSRYANGDQITVVALGTLERDGYPFLYWNTRADGTGLAHLPGDTFYMGHTDVTLYAYWLITPTYTVEYVSTGHTAGDPPEDTNEYAEDELRPRGNL